MASSLSVARPAARGITHPEQAYRGRILRVLHVINGEHYAGAERVQDLLALELPRHGFAVGFACIKPVEFPAARQAQYAPLYELPMRHRLDLRPVWNLVRIVRREGYRLLHAHTARSALVAALVSKISGVPMVHHVHSPTSRDSTHRWRAGVNALIERVVLRRASALIAVSGSLGGHVRRQGFGAEIVFVVPNGVPHREWLARPGRDAEATRSCRKTDCADRFVGCVLARTPENGNLRVGASTHPTSFPTKPRPPRAGSRPEWTLGTVALFRPRKGVEVLLQALGLLKSQGLPVRLRAVGGFETPEYERRITDLTEELGLTAAVEWTGFTRNVDHELGKMDLFVLPSLFGEGLPMVLLEAMAAGVPVVATRVEGIPEAIRDGRDGLIAEPGDAEDLAAALGRLIRGEVNWHALRSSALKRHSGKFSEKSMAAGVAAVYRRVLGEA